MIQYKCGDILGFQGSDSLSWGINLGTWGWTRGISHIGIVGRAEGEADKLLLYESTTLTGLPCWYAGKEVSGVQAHLIQDRVDSYKGKVWVYRPNPELSEDECVALSKFLRYHIGARYDYRGALRSRGTGALLRKVLPESGLEAIFCSEYVAAALQCLERVDLSYGGGWSPNRLKRYLFRENVVRLVSRVRPPVGRPAGCEWDRLGP